MGWRRDGEGAEAKAVPSVSLMGIIEDAKWAESACRNNRWNKSGGNTKMKITIGAVMLVAATFICSGAMIQMNRLRVIAEFPGASVKWVHIAEAQFEREKLDLNKYKVSVIEQENSMVVLLTGLKEPKGAIGSVGPDLGYEVEISKKDLKIIRSNYVR